MRKKISRTGLPRQCDEDRTGGKDNKERTERIERPGQYSKSRTGRIRLL
jgi:hypothetical protein